MAISKEKMKSLLNTHVTKGDTGSVEVQVAVLLGNQPP